MNPTVLVVDDDASMRDLLVAQLEDGGFRAQTASDATQALQTLSEASIDVVLTDLRMPGPSGTQLCADIQQRRTDIPVVVMTGFGSIANAIAAIRAGAYDFITKPFEFDALKVILDRALEHRRVHDELRALRRACTGRPGYEDLLGTSPGMQRVYAMVDRVASSGASVLLVGESGTGKELVARALHRRSPRSDGPFVAVNCAAVPEQLLESELFGHTKGAFTDARAGRSGLLRQAEGGTLFLDEVGDMSSTVQPKLLRALQERLVRPVGSDDEIRIDVRIVAATNRDMHKAIGDGAFRSDLYYRLAVVTIEIPPLRARGDDILLLAEHFLDERSTHTDRNLRLDPPAAAALMAHSWPGNVRELENAIEHAMALCTGEVIACEHLPATVHRGSPPTLTEPNIPVLLPLGEVERRHILKVLDAVGGNKSQAARILGIDRKTLHARLQRYGVD